MGLSAENFHRLQPGFRERVRREHADRIEADMRNLLSHVPLFDPFGSDTIEELATRCARRSFPEGARVISAGEEGDSFFLVVEGECVATSPSGKSLSRLVPGDYFGEMALLFGGTRVANVDTVRPTVCAVM